MVEIADTIVREGYKLRKIGRNNRLLKSALTIQALVHGEEIAEQEDHLDFSTYKSVLNNESIDEAIYAEQTFSPIFPRKSHFPVFDKDIEYYLVEEYEGRMLNTLLVIAVLPDLLPGSWEDHEQAF
jgi:hypothetical protein